MYINSKFKEIMLINKKGVVLCVYVKNTFKKNKMAAITMTTNFFFIFFFIFVSFVISTIYSPNIIPIGQEIKKKPSTGSPALKGIWKWGS